MPEELHMTTQGTVLPIIPPPMPHQTDVSPREATRHAGLPTRPAGLPTRVWKDTRGYHRKPGHRSQR